MACAIGLALVCALAVCLDLRAARADAGDLDLSFGGNGVGHADHNRGRQRSGAGPWRLKATAR